MPNQSNTLTSNSGTSGHDRVTPNYERGGAMGEEIQSIQVADAARDLGIEVGVFAPGVTQLFPDGQVIDLHPWEYNEVPVVLGAALREQAPIIALHLTRPKVTVPDREALGMASHFEAARGAYVIRAFREDLPRMGTVFVQGTSTTNNLVSILPELDRAGLNVKVVAAISRRVQDVLTEALGDLRRRRRSVFRGSIFAETAA